MTLALDRFSSHWTRFRGADGVTRPVHVFTYESHAVLYDVLVFENENNAKFYRKNCGPLSSLISNITPIHYAIESHFNV